MPTVDFRNVALCFFCFDKQKTAYEMRISDWSSDVCSPDLNQIGDFFADQRVEHHRQHPRHAGLRARIDPFEHRIEPIAPPGPPPLQRIDEREIDQRSVAADPPRRYAIAQRHANRRRKVDLRSEEHTSELQSLMRISYAVFCLKKQTPTTRQVSYT